VCVHIIYISLVHATYYIIYSAVTLYTYYRILWVLSLRLTRVFYGKCCCSYHHGRHIVPLLICFMRWHIILCREPTAAAAVPVGGRKDQNVWPKIISCACKTCARASSRARGNSRLEICQVISYDTRRNSASRRQPSRASAVFNRYLPCFALRVYIYRSALCALSIW